VTYTAEGPDSGTVDVGGATIRYTGLPPVSFDASINDNTSAVDRIFVDATGLGQQIRVENNSMSWDGISHIYSDTGAFAILRIVSPTNSLTVNAGDGDDSIALGQLDSTFNGTLTVNGEAGQDEINVRTLAARTDVNGGSENDTIRVSNLAGIHDDGTLNGITAELSIDAGPGSANRLIISDFGGYGNDDVVITSDQITGFAPATIHYAATGGSFTNGTAGHGILIRGSRSGADVFNIRSTLSGSTTTIEGNAGNDIFNISDVAPAGGGTLNGIAGPLTLLGQFDLDVLNMDDTGSTSAKTGTLTGTTLTGFAMAGGITYSELEAVNIALGSGSNQLSIAETHTGSTSVQAGAGTDVINIQSINGPTRVAGTTGNVTFNVGDMTPVLGGTASTINGPLQLDGGIGGARVAVAADEDFTLSNWNLRLSNGDSYSLSSIGEAVLTGGPGNNTFDVGNWTGAGILDGGGGNNQIVATEDADFVLSDASLTISTGADFSLGSVQSARLACLSGDHQLDASAFGGQVLLYGGSGNSALTGGSGDNYLDGGTGAATLIGGSGNNVLVGLNSLGATIYGGAGSNLIYGSPNADTVYGGTGPNQIYGDSGNDFLIGGPSDDVIVAGPGDDTIWGNGGSDVLVGESGDDSIYAINASGSGDDGKVDYLYGGPGNDTIHGGQGNDLIFGGGGTNLIDGGGPGSQIYPTSEDIPATPLPPVSMPADWPPTRGDTITLPTGPETAGRWAGLASSATDGGVSNSMGQAVEPSIVAGVGEQYVAWADSRTGQFKVYVAQYASGGWQELAGSAHGAGVSGSLGVSRRPSITLNASDVPMVAFTVFNGTSSDVFAMYYDATANGGQGDWIPLGSGNGQVSGTGAADDPVIVNTASGPVVAWLDSSTGTSNVYVAQLTAGTWDALGSGATSGTGVSASASSVTDLTLATDGTKVAIAWSQPVASAQQIYLREFSGGTWNALAGSASAAGVSNTSGQSLAPSLAYFESALFTAWQDNTSGHWSVYATRYNGTTWSPAGAGATSGAGISAVDGEATQPQIAANGGRLHLAWAHNRFFGDAGIDSVVYARRWTGSDFAEEVPGDATYGGVGGTVLGPEELAVAVDSVGHPFVAWNDRTSGNPEVFVRGNEAYLGTVYYVNDSLTAADEFATAGGSLAYNGLSPATPKPSVQAILDAYALSPGDVILVDAGTYADGFTLTAADPGVTIIGAVDESTVIQGAVILQNAIGAELRRQVLAGGVTLAASNNAALTSNSLGGPGLLIDGGSGNRVTHNIVTSLGSGITLTGGDMNTTIERNVITAVDRAVAITGTGTTDLWMRGNLLDGAAKGIELLVPASGQIAENEVSATSVGLDIGAAFAGLIKGNVIHHAALGVAYSAPADLSENRIHNNTTGVSASVGGTVDALGFVGSGSPNEIYANNLGVVLTGQMQNQHIHHNMTGVFGSGLLGGSDLELANLIEWNAIGVDLDGTIQFNRIAYNQAGILTRSDQEISHNLIYRNSVVGVHVVAQSDVRIISNTFYAPLGDNLRIESGASEVEVRNNVLWAESGYDILVSNDSQTGFFSDYNDLHASGIGQLVHWTLDFTDILDWQADAAQFDLHSVGRTVINPLWSEPRFANRALDDYRILNAAANQRFTSPTVNAGDPVSDLALRTGHPNLLVNPSFESGLSGWTVNLGASTRTTNPAAFQGNAYFFAGTDPAGVAEQTIDLLAAGFDTQQLDSMDFVIAFGGRIRTYEQTPLDWGEVRLTFLDALGAEIGVTSVLAANTVDRWELAGDRVSIPVGTRSLRYRFFAGRESGAENNSYLDHAQVFVLPETEAPDLGAYGNTLFDVDATAVPAADLNHPQEPVLPKVSAENLGGGKTTVLDASGTAAPQIALRFPDLYVDWERGLPHTIRWDTLANESDLPVRIDLYQDGPNGPAFLLNIADTTNDDGRFAWTPANDGVDFGSHGLRIHVSLVGNPAVFARSTEPFAVPENTATFYVNDADTADSEYTTAPGSNRNTGKLPSAPKPNPLNVLRTYSLTSEDTLFTDAGDYLLMAPILLSGGIGMGDDEAFVWTGPTDTSRVATLRHAHPATVAPLIELHDADYVTISHLTLNGAQSGIWAHGDSTELTATYLTVAGHSADGIRLDDTSTAAEFGNIVAANNGGYGIYASSSVGAVHDSHVYGNRQSGVYLSSVGNVDVLNNLAHDNVQTGFYIHATNGTILGNTSYGNGTGIAAVASSGQQLVVSGNTVHDNTGWGISSSGNVLIEGNTVYGQAGNGGISLSYGAEARANVVHGNTTGIHIWQNGGSVFNNRIYNNTTGIVGDDYSSLIRGNVIYSNSVGIDGSGQIENNLVYANSNQGMAIYYRSSVINNTVYQPVGNAIEVEWDDVALRNNIFWVEAGFAVSVLAPAQSTFSSDFNLLYTTGAGQAGNWSGVARPTLSAWQTATFTDLNSIAQDPWLVDPDGSDDQLGFADPDHDGRDDDFHLMSTAGRFTGSLAPVLDTATGLPVFLPVTEAIDILQSPAIDRGDDSSSYDSEPGSNGGFVNLGSFGNTPLASQSPEQYVLVMRPDGGEVWPAEQTFPIRWRSHDWLGTVDVDLMREGNVAYQIADDILNDGEFQWNIADTVLPGENYRVRVTRSDNASLLDDSNDVFSITEAVTNYYVNIPNDADLSNNEYTTAPGDDGNDGLSPATPKASVRAVLETYNLKLGDVILVDTGTYLLTTNIVLATQDSGVTIRGPVAAGHAAVLDRGSASYDSYVLELIDADGITLDHLHFTGGYYGVYAAYGSDSDDVTISHSEAWGNDRQGIWLGSDSERAVIVDNRLHGNWTGLDLDGAGATVSGNEAFDNSGAGLGVSGTGTTVSDNTLYGNGTGIAASASSGEQLVVSGNTVHDNTGWGISSSGNVLIEGNTVYGQAGNGGISLSYGAEARANVVHGNTTGIHIWQNGGRVFNNRIYNNTTGIVGDDYSSLIRGNLIYSNSVGIDGSGQIENNLVYANSNQGMAIYWRSSVINNTVYQPVGNAIEAEREDIVLRNNIFWVEAGFAVSVLAAVQPTFSSDYNLIHTGANPNARVGSWGGTIADELADWQAIALQDQNSVAGDPLFLDIDGSDNVFAYDPSGNGYDGGRDDNFYLSAFSPAIDRADEWAAPLTDIFGSGRVDDPAVPNLGSPDYVVADLGSNDFTNTGISQGWRLNDTYRTLNFPPGFTFPFYESSYSSVSVSTEGFLKFSGPIWGGDGGNTFEKLRNSRIIAPLWDNLHTTGAGDDIYVDTSISGQVMIRWDATNQADGSDVNVAVTLFDDGRIQFHYGAGNTNLTPTVGISRGDDRFYVLSTYDGLANLTGVDSVEFVLTPGETYTDMGAYEFRGDSSDTTPPRILATTPAAIDIGALVRSRVTEIEILFSEEINANDANALANYELRRAVNGVFGDGDDLVYTPATNYVHSPGASVVTLDLNLGGAALPPDTYRFTVRGNIVSNIHDTTGNRLDGNGDGTEGPDYVRTFVVPPAGITVTPTSGLVTTEAGGTATFTVVLDTQPGSDVIIGLSSSVVSEGTVSPDSLTFTPDDWNTPQTVTVTGANDVLDDGDVVYSVVTAAAISNDPAYAGQDPPDVTVTNLDNDPAEVVGRHIFYNNSKWDGHTGFTKGDPAANEFDVGAIATDKVALLPGQTGTFANYTSYPRGINGIMVDIWGLTDPLAVKDDDFSEFDFKYGNDDTPEDWLPAADPTDVDVRDIGGGVHRVTFIWADKAIPNKNWLQVTVKQHPNTGLAADDVFYFGNTIGENTGDFRVDYSDAFDIIWPLLGTPLAIGPDHVADINRDGRIDYSDVFDDLWPNLSGPAPLKPISPPVPPPALLESTDSVFDEDLSWAIELVWFDRLYGSSGDPEEDDPLEATAVDGVFSVYYEE
jgi:hypothetical protein